MKPQKTNQQLNQEAAQRRAEAHTRLTPEPGSRPPRDTAEQHHAHQVEASAASMRKRGFTAYVSTSPQVYIYIAGPQAKQWEADEARTLLAEVPSYTTPHDYALAVFEQEC